VLTTAIVLVALGSVAAQAQRYDSSYGYEMRGFVPPSPFPRDLERKDGEHTTSCGVISCRREAAPRGRPSDGALRATFR
jgi:hypothetical protein